MVRIFGSRLAKEIVRVNLADSRGQSSLMIADILEQNVIQKEVNTKICSMALRLFDECYVSINKFTFQHG